MGDELIAAIGGVTSSLLEELAEVRAESERLRAELEHWGDAEDDRPTIPVPRLHTTIPADRPSRIDTLRCA